MVDLQGTLVAPLIKGAKTGAARFVGLMTSLMADMWI